MALIKTKLPARRHLTLIERSRQEYLSEFKKLMYYNPDTDLTKLYLNTSANLINACSLTDTEDCFTDICKLKGLKKAYESLK